jgi:alkanesulfonate monooxygenase SsuD/methylene tetrahydromethanopterin reductase-like flavin-dependent oxidoreductase (luciferase family)
MRFGLLVPHFGNEADQERLAAGARLAETLGFDSIWVRDHLVFQPHSGEGTGTWRCPSCGALHGVDNEGRTFIEPFVTLAYLAAVTKKIGLGTATIIPFRHPIHMAYCVASLSWISRRRFELGVGSGNVQHEFDVVGLGTADRPTLMKEQVMIARRLWTGQSVELHSDRYDFADVDLKPRPLHPVFVWWGGSTPASARLAVDFCDGWLPGRITFSTYEARIAKIRALCDRQQRSMVMTGVVPVTSIGSTTDEARQHLRINGLINSANAQKYWVKPPSGAFTRVEDLEGSILAGTPDDVLQGIERYRQIGCDLIVFDFRVRFHDWLEQIETLGREVLPRVSSVSSGAAVGSPAPTSGTSSES